MKSALVAWAQEEVRRHPNASDSYAVIAAVVVDGVERSPTVTLGELRALVLSVNRVRILSAIIRRACSEASVDDLSLVAASEASQHMGIALDRLALYHGADDLAGAAALVRAALGRVDGVVAKMRR